MSRFQQKCIRVITALFAVLLFSIGLSTDVSATGLVDMEKPASLGIVFTRLGAEVDGMPFRAYRVFSVNAIGEYNYTAPYATYKMALPEGEKGFRKLALTVQGYIERDGIKPDLTGVTDKGELNFGTVEKGIYLILADDYTYENIRYTVTPSMVQVPARIEGDDGLEYEYDVVCEPKYKRKSVPPETPPETTPPETPPETTPPTTPPETTPPETVPPETTPPETTPPEETPPEKIPPSGEPSEYSLNVRKVWQRRSTDSKDKIPEKIEVQLLLEGNVVETAKLTEKNNWRHTFKGLDPAYADKYNIVEKDVPDGWTVSVQRSGTLFVITNSEPEKETTPPANPPERGTGGGGGKLPQTGQNWLIVIILFGAGILSLCAGLILRNSP